MFTNIPHTHTHTHTHTHKHTGAKTDVCSSRLSHNSDLVPASTPLLIAVALNSLRMMHILINAFCDVNLAAMVSLNNNNNTDGCEGLTEALMTPLQLSLHAKSFHATVVLIKLGSVPHCYFLLILVVLKFLLLCSCLLQ